MSYRVTVDKFNLPLNNCKIDQNCYQYEFTPKYDFLLTQPHVVKALCSKSLLEWVRDLENCIDLTVSTPIVFSEEDDSITAILQRYQTTFSKEQLRDPRVVLSFAISLIMNGCKFKISTEVIRYKTSLVQGSQRAIVLDHLYDFNPLNLITDAYEEDQNLLISYLDLLLIEEEKAVIEELIERITPVPAIPSVTSVFRLPFQYLCYCEDLEKLGFTATKPTKGSLTSNVTEVEIVNPSSGIEEDRYLVVDFSIPTRTKLRISRGYTLTQEKVIWWILAKDTKIKHQLKSLFQYYGMDLIPSQRSIDSIVKDALVKRHWVLSKDNQEIGTMCWLESQDKTTMLLGELKF